MKRVRITIDPPDGTRPAIYDRMTREAEYLSDVRIVNWNVTRQPIGFLLRFRGDYRRFEDELAADDAVEQYAVVPISECECHCYLSGTTGSAAAALFENFTRGSLLTVPPVLCHDDGSSTFTIVGTEEDIQGAVDEVPDGVALTIDRVGADRLTPEDARSKLSAGQRDAVAAALAVGYYDIPREATTEDVGDELGCATTTAAEHLRKAEAKVLRAFFDR